jgi:hypothetical protein
MSEISDFLATKQPIKGKYEILTVSHPNIEANYGTISIVKVKLDNNGNKPLVIVPGYSTVKYRY